MAKNTPKHKLLIKYPETLDERLVEYLDVKGTGTRTSTFIDALNEKLAKEDLILKNHN